MKRSENVLWKIRIYFFQTDEAGVFEGKCPLCPMIETWAISLFDPQSKIPHNSLLMKPLVKYFHSGSHPPQPLASERFFTGGGNSECLQVCPKDVLPGQRL